MAVSETVSHVCEKILVLDIGGTAIKSGVFHGGTLSDVREWPTEAARGGAHVMQNVFDIVDAYRRTHSLDKIGISTAGQVDPVQRRITYANSNIPHYTGTPVGALVETHCGIPVRVENDVYCAALGEAAYGAGKGLHNFVCLTFGTGIGGAIVADGNLYSGANFSAGQFGALVTHPEDISDGDYYSGGYERYASVTALVKRAMAFDPALSSGRRVFEALENRQVAALVDAWIDEIVLGLRSVVHLLNPEAVILNGGVMEQPYITVQIQKKLLPKLMPTFRDVCIQKGRLGSKAGMYGAAVLWDKH